MDKQPTKSKRNAVEERLTRPAKPKSGVKARVSALEAEVKRLRDDVANLTSIVQGLQRPQNGLRVLPGERVV